MTKVELKTGEIFAGAGGLGLGFILAEHPIIKFQPLFAIDNDANSVSSYKHNMNWLHQNASSVLPQKPGVFNRDVEQLKIPSVLRWAKLEAGELDLLIGGPPCQGFSSSNKTSKADNKTDRNRLTKVFFDKVNDFQPKMFLIENVQGLRWTKPTDDMAFSNAQESMFPEYASHPPTNVREFLIQKATALGYQIWHGILDAVNFGVPQHRLRFFLFGVRQDLLTKPNSISLISYLNKLMITDHVSVSKAIGDLPEVGNGQSWNDDGYHPSEEEYVQKMRNFMVNGDLYDHFTTKHADYVIERYKKIPEGQNWKSIRNEMTNYKTVENTHSNIYRRLKRDEPANTISHYRKSMLIHPTQHRGLSFREACRLQSFPDWFRFMGTSNQQQQQLANAVPPLMASKVAYSIAECWLNIQSEEIREISPTSC